MRENRHTGSVAGPTRPDDGRRSAKRVGSVARRGGLAGLGGLGAALWVLAACGGPSAASRNAATAARVRADQARVIARQAGLAPDVGDFLARAAGASGQRYTVVYSSGAGQQTTVISDPPNRQIDVQGVSGADSLDRFIVKGSSNYVCHRGGGKWVCQASGPAVGTGAFTSDAITQTISALAPLASTYSFTISHRTIAAQPATCLTVDLLPGQRTSSTFGDHAALCIAPNGVILEEDLSGSPLRALSYRTSVPSGAFALPARPAPAPS